MKFQGPIRQNLNMPVTLWKSNQMEIWVQFPFLNSESWRIQSVLIFLFRLHITEIWAFCHFVTSNCMSCVFMKEQNGRNSLGLPMIMKISALSFLQLSKLDIVKCPYFWDQTSYNWDMNFLSFCDLRLNARCLHEITKWA